MDPVTLLTSHSHATVTLAQQRYLSRFMGLILESKPERERHVLLMSNTHCENELHPNFAYWYENVTSREKFPKALASLRNCNPTFNMKETWQISVGGGQLSLIAISVTSVGKRVLRHLWKGPEILLETVSQMMSHLPRYLDLLLDL